MGKINILPKYILFTIVFICSLGCGFSLKNTQQLPANKQVEDVDTKVKSKFVSNLFSYAEDIMKINGPEVALDSLLKIQRNYNEENVPAYQKSLYNQVVMTYYSFVSDNKKSLLYEQKSFNSYRGNEEDTGVFDVNYLVISAKQYILNRLANERLIMLNESHNRGQNRAFIRELLPDLKEKGFHYLAVEAISYKDTNLNYRGFPARQSGYYLSEPAFGQLIRDALKLGFHIVAYEDSSKYNPTLSPIEGQNKRIINQTNNLLRVLNKDTTAKMIIYGRNGYRKSAQIDVKTMGGSLSEALNYDVFSVDCSRMLEGYNLTNENLHYIEAISKFKLQEPSVLIRNNIPFVETSYKGSIDAEIFFPRTNYDLYYPNWLKESEDNPYLLTLPNNDEFKNKLLLVYKTNEWSDLKKEAIPIIQFYIPTDTYNFELFLNEGNYDVFIFKNGYDILFNTKLVVKNK